VLLPLREQAMGRWWCVVLQVLWLCGPARAEPAALTATEMRWLKAAWPVLAYAREAGMPMDVLVQPQPTAGLPPVALAYTQGRCKLVLSMRGNPEVQATEKRLPPDLFDVALQLMAAHEMGHCHRHVQGAWFAAPQGKDVALPARLDASVRAAWLDMQAVRREEGYADLVGLAWVQQHQPEQYARVLAWLVGERSQAQAGSHHDTRAWARLAGQPERWVGTSIFKAADSLWLAGLEADF
jgi:hypothetical protein